MLVTEPQSFSGIIAVPSKVDEVLKPARFVGHFIMASGNILEMTYCEIDSILYICQYVDAFVHTPLISLFVSLLASHLGRQVRG